VKSEAVASSLGDGFDVVPWVGDHKVAVEMGVGQMLPETGYDGCSKSKVGYKMAACSMKYPSMMSICKELAPISIISWHSLNRKAKSAERIDGPTTHFLSCILIIITDLMELNKISLIISVKIWGIT
jgi:hypothetical protein